MPRKIDPAKIKVGHGLATSDSVEVNAMIPSGAGTAPAGLTTHVQDEHKAHPAHSISIDDVPKTYDSDHVEGVLDELSALVPPRPSPIGFSFDYLAINTLPDWGILKLDDASIAERHPSLGFEWEGWLHKRGMEVYPYFWHPPQVAKMFPVSGNDPADPVFNTWAVTYQGGGAGNAHAGAFTRMEGTPPEPTFHSTATIIQSSGPAGGTKVVVSGIVYPADRGTLALIRCEPGGELDLDTLGDLETLSGVNEYPTRIKCAILAWHTMKAALSDDSTAVSTE